MFFSESIMAQGVYTDSAQSVRTEVKKPFYSKAIDAVMGVISPEVDTTYIEPQKYNFTAMLLTSHNYDSFTLRSNEEYSIRLAPESRTSIGPYFGWRWIFLGYKFDLSFLEGDKGNTDINMDFYTSALGINLLYRRMNGYKFKSCTIGEEDLSKYFKDTDCPGFQIYMEGVNAYYIFNHRQYSQQAIFNQTNRQLRNAGSWIIGSGYNHHHISIDWDNIRNKVKQMSNNKIELNPEAKTFDDINYSTISVSGGYGYNWVLTDNLSMGFSAIGDISYLCSSNQISENRISHEKPAENISYRITFDGCLKLGAVWNNSKWFVGGSAIFNSFNYHHDSFWGSNLFGTLNAYIGYNFY